MIRLAVQGSRWLASGSLGVDSCVAFCELLRLAAGANDEANVLDLSGVESIDMKGVQVLAAFLRAAPGNRIEAPSVPVRAFLSRVGALTTLVSSG